MSTELNRIERRIARLNNRMASTSHQGVIKEVKGDKIRVVMGKGPNGEEVLSPWLDTSNHRGGARERRFYEVGQNVTVDNPNGDWGDNATVSADAPNEKFKAPNHADDHKKGETYQLGEYYRTHGKDFDEQFLAEEEKDDNTQQSQNLAQGGGEQGQQQQQGQKKQKYKDPTMKRRMHKERGITNRVGNDDKAARCAVHKDGVHMRFGDDFLYINKSGIYASKPIQVSSSDPIPNDND